MQSLCARERRSESQGRAIKGLTCVFIDSHAIASHSLSLSESRDDDDAGSFTSFLPRLGPFPSIDQRHPLPSVAACTARAKESRWQEDRSHQGQETMASCTARAKGSQSLEEEEAVPSTRSPRLPLPSSRICRAATATAGTRRSPFPLPPTLPTRLQRFDPCRRFPPSS